MLKLSSVIGLVGVLLTMIYINKGESPPPPPYVPQYQAGDCFVSNEPRETWEPAADGIIIRVGQAKYLWEPWDLALKNHDKKPWRRNEYAIPSSIKGLDSTTRKVECPNKGVTYYN